MTKVHASKLNAESAILGRRFHADVVELGQEPKVLILMFGGSGVSEEQYLAHEHTMHPALRPAWATLETLSLTFVYLTAPFDIRFAAFDEHPDDVARWNQHVEDDLMARWPELPIYLIGHSGGLELALWGAHEHERVIGVGGLGADGMNENLLRPANWREPMRLVYNPKDVVRSKNTEALERLEEDEVARVLRARHGGHSLEDYVGSDAFAGLLRWAHKLATERR